MATRPNLSGERRPRQDAAGFEPLGFDSVFFAGSDFFGSDFAGVLDEPSDFGAGRESVR